MRAPKRHFRKVREYQKIINQLFSNEEWQSHQAQEEIPDATSEKMRAFIMEKIGVARDQEAYRKDFKMKLIYVGKYLSAACFITIVGFALWQLTLKAPVMPRQVQNSIARQAPSEIWTEVHNRGNELQRVQLPDSSIVSLSPKSSLKYAQKFSQKFRDVYLSGKAYFKVKRNPNRPFSVYAGGLKTTALGTSFTINTAESRRRTSVVLHTGKIVIRQTNTIAEPIYIARAGGGLMYDTQDQTAQLTNVKPIKKAVPESSFYRRGSALVMKNIPLQKVISLLNEAYQVNISTAGKDIANITYTGTVDPAKEQLEQALQVICLINNLNLSRGANQEFIIQKSNKQTQ